MNIPVSDFLRRKGARRLEISLFCLLAGLLMPLSFAGAQTPVATSFNSQTSVGALQRVDPQPDLAEFSAWAARSAKTQCVGEANTATPAEVMQLVERRRMVLAALMQTDPARALASRIADSVRAKLPADVLSRMETPFATVGDFSVDAQSGRQAITINGRMYGAHVDGQQLGSISRSGGVSLRGFTLDDEAVVDASPAPAVASPRVQRAPAPQLIGGNDFFSRAYPLSRTSGSVNDSNVGATKEFGEPNHAGNVGGASVWYVWTPLSSGQATFVTDDNQGHYAVDTLLAVYTGTSVSSLTAVASNDDADGYNSEVDFFAQAGVTYHIAVDGYNGGSGPSEGSFTLSYLEQGDPLSPSVTSSGSIQAEVNTYFTYAITATNNPTSFGATGLPVGLNLDPTTGIVTGIPTTLGTYTVVLSATNSEGTGALRLNLTVNDQPTHFPFFSTEIALPQSPGFYYLHLVDGNIFGYYAFLDDPNYIYHIDLGFEYTFDAQDGRSGIYLYDFTSNTFFYTSPTFPFPYLYDFSLQAVLYYFPDPNNPARFNTNGVRYFYDLNTGQIITK